MPNKVTIQDIAAALGLSRNTVSKAMNNTGVLADSTRQKILQKAKEMGYKQFAFLAPDEQPLFPVREIALFSSSVLAGSHFSAPLLDAFQKKISQHGISLTMYPVREKETSSLSLPLNFRRETTAGIIIIEMFDEAYSRYLCQQGIPTLFVDTAANISGFTLNSDILMMENHNSTFRMTQSIIDQGAKRIAFVGDRYHCQSFYERWCGFAAAMAHNGLPSLPSMSILAEDASPYEDALWLSSAIKALPQMPQAFCCANDFQAINVFRALKHIGLRVPDDAMLYGFDDAMEARIMDPPLTTARIPGQSMGFAAADLLLSRIRYPKTAYSTVYVQTEVIPRASTRQHPTKTSV